MIVGWILGLAIGTIVSAAIENIVKNLLEQYGIENYFARGIEFVLINQSGLFVPNFHWEINITDVLSIIA